MKPQARLSSSTTGLTLYLNEELGERLRANKQRWAPSLICHGYKGWQFRLSPNERRLAVVDYAQGVKSGWPYRMSIGSNALDIEGTEERPLFGVLDLKLIDAGGQDFVFDLPPESEWEAPRTYVRSGGRSSARVPSERELSPEVAAVRRMGELIREINELRPQIEGLKLQVVGPVTISDLASAGPVTQYEMRPDDSLRGTIVRTEVLK